MGQTAVIAWIQQVESKISSIREFLSDSAADGICVGISNFSERKHYTFSVQYES